MLKQPLKIAILTEYYNSNNYGGVLQAYALTKVLNKEFGMAAEQLCYQKAAAPVEERIEMRLLLTDCKQFLRKTARKLIHQFFSATFARNELKQIPQRETLIHRFADRIPHSAVVYNDESIKNCVNFYDAFIVGSDQVWRNFSDRAYWLEFVPSSKIKLSYAASIARDYLNEDEKDFFQTALKDFNAVSVREESAVSLLQDCCNTKPQWVLDPTLLLDRSQWDAMCSERKIEGDYLFFYFLGMSKKHRWVVSQYAKRKHLKVVFLPYLRGRFELCDAFLGNRGQRLLDVSPSDFISLIKNATCVVTDSFHATVFSEIYQKEFFVFERPEKVSMRSRIDSLMKIFATENRYCDTKEKQTVQYMEACLPMEHALKNPKYENLKTASLAFLKQNLGIM